MRKEGSKRRLCGLAAVILAVCIVAVLWIGKYVNERNAAQREAELRPMRYERAVPIYSAEEGAEVLELLDEQVNPYRMSDAEENADICVWYSLTGKVFHKEVFERFLQNVEQGVEDAVIVVESDWEAHLNVHFISYRDGEFFYVFKSDWQYYGDGPLMREFPCGKVGEMSIRLSVTEDEAELDEWDDTWRKQADEAAAAYENGEMSWDEYQAWLMDRRERSKERPYVVIHVSEESYI